MTDKIIDRVKKMLALSNDAGATEQERETALRMAHAFLLKHNLSMSDLPSGDENIEVRENRTSKSGQIRGLEVQEIQSASCSIVIITSAKRTKQETNITISLVAKATSSLQCIHLHEKYFIGGTVPIAAWFF